jgi:transposase-like protein
MPQRKFGKSKCPSCKSENNLRISRPRSSWERTIQLLTFFRFYRCKKCGWRGLKLNFSLEATVIKKGVIYLLLMLVAAFIVFNLLKLVV